jgi:peroxiredoxin
MMRAVTEGHGLQRGDSIPHLEIRTLDGGTFTYREIWQHKNLVLVALPEAPGDEAYASELARHAADFHEQNSVAVVTRDRIPGLAAPGVAVADRWGEIVHVAVATEISALPAAPDLIEWLQFVRRRCSG